MVNGTRLPQIRSRKCRNRSKCRRCSCDRQPFPRRRARVGDLCGFPDTAERVPARSPKTGRCADVRECPAELQRRSRSVCGRLSAEGEAASGRGRTKPRCRAHPATVASARGADSSGISQRGCCRHENSPDGVRKAKSPAVSRKTAGLRTEIGGILAWQATRSSFRSG